MLRLRSVIVQQLSARCFTGRFYNTAVRGRASYFYPKSRSRPSSAIPPSRLPGACRHMSSISSLNNNDVQKRVEDISDKFKEAMELLEDAVSTDTGLRWRPGRPSMRNSPTSCQPRRRN